MSICIRPLFIVCMLLWASSSAHVAAADMTFQFVNDTDRALNLKLFSRGESLQQWPGRSKAYSLRPNTAVQQLKISCTEGERICWGAWMTVQSVSGEIGNGQRMVRNTQVDAGAGERGLRDCLHCCHVCEVGKLTPVVGLSISSSVGPDVR